MAARSFEPTRTITHQTMKARRLEVETRATGPPLRTAWDYLGAVDPEARNLLSGPWDLEDDNEAMKKLCKKRGLMWDRVSDTPLFPEEILREHIGT